MPLAFIDASALVKLFVAESGSTQMRILAAADSPHLVALLELTRVEVHSALRRRERLGQIAEGTTRAAQEALDLYIASSVVTQAVTRTVLDRACALIDRYALRAYDAIQLAGALELALVRPAGAVAFVAADRELLAAARIEGLRPLDPSAPEGNP
jgi:predicted nucleic acid-binding protein